MLNHDANESLNPAEARPEPFIHLGIETLKIKDWHCMGFVGAVVELGTDILAAGGVLYFIKQPRRMVFSNIQFST